MDLKCRSMGVVLLSIGMHPVIVLKMLVKWPGEFLGSNQHTRKPKRDADVSSLLDKMERRK